MDLRVSQWLCMMGGQMFWQTDFESQAVVQI
jgi:hypothetical protein